MVEAPGQVGTGPGTDGSVLVVCRANVCRSPATALLLADALRTLGIDWSVGSAGTAAAPDFPGICPITATALVGSPGAAELVERHLPRQVTASLLDSSALVLAASQSERSAVARLSPTTRNRTFTLVEAALLTASASQLSAGGPVPGVNDASSYARMLHRHRGRAVPSERVRWRRRHDVRHDDTDSLDVADPHAHDGPDHDLVLARIRWAVDHLTTALGELQAHETRTTDQRDGR